MEVINILNSVNAEFGTLVKATWMGRMYTHLYLYQPPYLLFCTGIIAIIIIIWIKARKWFRQANAVSEASAASSTRFRKRDKALFYGRKMLRKVKSISGQVRNSGQGRKRKMVMKFARRLLQLRKDNETEQLKVLEPPAEYLEEDLLNVDERVPRDVLYLLQSIRVFGHFEKPVFLKLCQHTEIMNVAAGSFLFKIGDPDENIFVVQSGLVNVCIAANDGSTLSLKIVKAGESVTSLLSFADFLIGHSNSYRTVFAKAVEDSTIVKLPMAAFQDVFQEYPDIVVRVIQVIMVRLQRVTFTALHHYLGLTTELLNQSTKSNKHKSTFLPSPTHSKMKDVKKNEETDSLSWETDLSKTASRPIPVPIHRRSRSFLESKSLSISNAPDMVSDLDRASGNILPDLQLPQIIRSRHETDETTENLSGSQSPQHKLKPSASSEVDDIHQSSLRSKRFMSDEEGLLQYATEAFVKEFGLEDDTMLQGKVEYKELAAGSYLIKGDINKDIALIYIISGSFTLSPHTDDEEEVFMCAAHSGEVLGGLSVLTGESSFFVMRAKHFTRVGIVSKTTFYEIIKEKPHVVLNIADTVVKKLSPFVRQIDFALDWMFVESGRAVYRQDAESDSTFIILSGRLRSVMTLNNGKKELVGEYGRGDLVGVVEMVTQSLRITTVMAVRDSELARLPEGLFNAIKLRFPIVVTRLINLLGHRILGTWKKPSLSVRAPGASSAIDSRPSQINFSTVAIVAVSDDVPLTSFTYELYHCLSAIGATLRLTSDVIRKTLGASIMDPIHEYRLTTWLAQQEDQHKIALYQCDLTFSTWTQRCIRQADCIIIVGLGENTPTVGKVEREIQRLAIRTQKELILLHRDEAAIRPKNTVAWLNMRTWISWHHHIQCSKRMFSRKSLYRINDLYSKVCMSEPNIHSDFSRLARWLMGKSVGLVLGGGGARGAAHIGMIKAIQEAGIPIDMVGGVSIGAFMGALWCQERNITTVTQKAREWARKMTQWWRQIMDLTYPVTSMFTGRDFNQTIYSTFGDTFIEDLWLPYFTITTDITASCMRVHSHGSLWRYVRASMSLSGYMPPLCDPSDGHLLLDGGYTNNLPADVMRSLGANHILAVDVGSVDDQELTNYGDDLSGWWLLWKRWYPFTTNVKVPNLPDIQSRLAYVCCVRQLEEVKNSDYCDYIRPPIDKYRTLQFSSFDEIREVGYQHGNTHFEGQLRDGLLPLFKTQTIMRNVLQHPAAYTFTDLAQIVCKVSKEHDDESSSSSSDYAEDEYDEGHGYASEPSVGIVDRDKTILMHARRTGGSLSLSENELEESDFDMAPSDEPSPKK